MPSIRRCLPAILAAFAASQGCGPSYPSGTIVLHVANWGGAKEGTEDDKRVEQIYSEFERQNPGVHIQEDSIPGSGEYVPKMALAYIAHAQPDIMMLDLSSAALFINSHMVSDLEPFIKGDEAFHQDDYFPNVFDTDRRGDAVYAIPNDFTPMVVYYNKRMFDRAGIPYPTGDWNFAKFRETAAKLTIPGRQYGFTFVNESAMWLMWFWNAGGDYISLDTGRAEGVLDAPAAVKAITFLSELVKDGYAPSMSQVAATGVEQFPDADAAMTISGHWSLSGYKHPLLDKSGKPKLAMDDIGVAPLPHDVPQSQTVMYESGYAISEQCKHKDLAWKFVKFMTSHYAQSLYQMSGIAVCGRKDVAEERAKASALEASFLPIIPSCRPPYGSRIEGHEFIEAELRKAMDSIIQSGRDPYQAVHRAAIAIDREMAK